MDDNTSKSLERMAEALEKSAAATERLAEAFDKNIEASKKLADTLLSIRNVLSSNGNS